MNFHIIDILSVSTIGMIAFIFILRTYLKGKKNKCITLCSGCTKDSCGTRVFKQSNSKKIISLKPVS